MNRRGFLKGLIIAAVAPAIIRTPGLLMPIKPRLTRLHGWTRIELLRASDEWVVVVHPSLEEDLRLEFGEVSMKQYGDIVMLDALIEDEYLQPIQAAS